MDLPYQGASSIRTAVTREQSVVEVRHDVRPSGRSNFATVTSTAVIFRRGHHERRGFLGARADANAKRLRTLDDERNAESAMTICRSPCCFTTCASWIVALLSSKADGQEQSVIRVRAVARRATYCAQRIVTSRERV
jgi:hypothetical protein